MSKKQLHEIDFQSNNHYDLFIFTQFLHLDVEDAEQFTVEKQEWHDRYKVSLGGHTWLIKADYLPKFWLALNEAKYDEVKDKINQTEELKYVPFISLDKIDTNYDTTSPFYDLFGEDYLNVDRRMTGLVKATSTSIREIANLINKEMDAIARDTDVVKDFDAMLTFDTPLGGDFKAHLCFDRIPAVSEDLEGFVVQRTPITEEDLKTYLRETGPKIQSRLDHINSLVKAMFESKQIANNKFLYDYAAMCVTATLATAFLNQNVNYITFGGMDNWKSDGPETPNNKACFVYLDKEVDKLFALLESIPLEDGVDHYSIDIDTFGIFGRKDNRVVTPCLQGYTKDILKGYSQGFERVLSARLSLLDSVHIFKA